MPDASHRLEANGVRFAWQMAQFSDSDWDQLGVSLGMKTAAKAELAEPSACSPPDSSDKFKTQDDLSDRVRRFLLLPDADGREARPLGEMSALFLGLLGTPVADRQSLLLALCELMALVSGLFLSTPFELRSNSAPSSGSAAASAWVVPPTLADGMDALVAFVFLITFHVATFAVTMALYVAASGNQADDAFCEAVMSVLGVCLAFFFVGVFFPLLGLCFWRFFHDAASPYPMLANVLIVGAFHHAVGGRTQRFLAEAIALEVYHGPRWLLSMLRSASRFRGTTPLIAEKPLKAAAERRAAKLRAQMMVLDTAAAAAGATSPGTARAAAAASPEPRARRHLRVVAATSS